MNDSMPDEFYFNDTQETDPFGIVKISKTRLVKYIDKKTGEFIQWSLEVKESVNKEESLKNLNKILSDAIERHKDNKEYIETLNDLYEMVKKYVLENKIIELRDVCESGFFDFTEEGSFFGLTENQKERALIKKMSKIKL